MLKAIGVYFRIQKGRLGGSSPYCILSPHILRRPSVWSIRRIVDPFISLFLGWFVDLSFSVGLSFRLSFLSRFVCPSVLFGRFVGRPVLYGLSLSTLHLAAFRPKPSGWSLVNLVNGLFLGKKTRKFTRRQLP